MPGLPRAPAPHATRRSASARRAHVGAWPAAARPPPPRPNFFAPVSSRDPSQPRCGSAVAGCQLMLSQMYEENLNIVIINLNTVISLLRHEVYDYIVTINRS
jgi:hypothetical protein